MAALVIVFAGIKLAAEIVDLFYWHYLSPLFVRQWLKQWYNAKCHMVLLLPCCFILILIVFFFLAGLINSSVQEFTRSIPQYKVLLSERINDVMALAQKLKLPIVISREAIMEHFDPSVIMNFVSRLLLKLFWCGDDVFMLILAVIFYATWSTDDEA